MKSILTAAVFGLCSCSTTSILATWKKPGVGPLSFNKVAVIASAKDPSYRRSIEDQVARAMQIKAVPSYTLPGMAKTIDKEALKATLNEQGFDGALVVRVLSVDKEATWVPSTSMDYGYGYGAWPMYDPGYMQVDTYVRVETDIYGLPDEGLLFSASSRTANPSNVTELVEETMKAVREELKKEGLAPEPVSVVPGKAQRRVVVHQ